MSENPIAGNCTAEQLANMSVSELQSFKSSYEKVLRAVQEKQKHVATAFEQFMSHVHDTEPSLYQEFQKDIKARMNKVTHKKAPGKGGGRAPGKAGKGSTKTKASSKKASKSAAAKRRASGKASGVSSPTKASKRAKITSQKRNSKSGKKAAAAATQKQNGTDAPTERPKATEHPFWVDVAQHFEVPTAEDIAALRALKEEVTVGADAYFELPPVEPRQPRPCNIPPTVPSVAHRRVHINSVQPSTLGLRLLGTLLPDQRHQAKPCVFPESVATQSLPLKTASVSASSSSTSSSTSSSAPDSGMLCDIAQDSAAFDTTLTRQLHALGALVDSEDDEADDSDEEHGHDGHSHHRNDDDDGNTGSHPAHHDNASGHSDADKSSFSSSSSSSASSSQDDSFVAWSRQTDQRVKGSDSTSTSFSSQHTPSLHMPSILPPDEVTEELKRAQAELRSVDDTVSHTLRLLLASVESTDLAAERSWQQHEQQLEEVNTQLEELFAKYQTYSSKQQPLPKNLKEQIRAALRHQRRLLDAAEPPTPVAGTSFPSVDVKSPPSRKSRGRGRPPISGTARRASASSTSSTKNGRRKGKA